MRAEDLIKQLTAELRPVRALQAPAQRACVWGVLSMVFAVALMNAIEPMTFETWHNAFHDVRWTLRIVACAALTLLATWATFITNVPGLFSRTLKIAIYSAVTLCVFTFLPYGGFQFLPHKRHACIVEVFVNALTVSLLFSIPLRAGFTVSRRDQLGLLWLCCVSIALLPMEGSCVVNHAHSFFLHLVPALIGAGIGIGVLRKMRVFNPD